MSRALQGVDGRAKILQKTVFFIYKREKDNFLMNRFHIKYVR